MDKTKILKDGAYEYNVKDLLGEGSFAKVYKGIITKNNRVVAVRLLPLDLIKQYGNKIKEIIQGEVGVLKDLSQSNSVDALFTTRIYDCFLTNHNVVMILQFCPEGNLQDTVKLGALPEEKAIEIMYQLARGLEFIAKQKVVHRDIKPDNVFVKNEGKYKVYKLGDFGFAVKKQLNDEIVGTPIFMSPQLFKEEKYGSEVDVWAFGLMAHYVLFKQYYFIAATEKQIKNKVLNHQYTLKQHHLKKISPQMADFLTQCLQNDKKKRMPASKISEHPVFNSARGKIEQMIVQCKEISGLEQSKLTKNTVKGELSNHIMKYQFLFDLATFLAQYDRYNIASLYILKYNLAEVVGIKKDLQMRNNLINHPKWQIFAQGPEYMGFVKMVDQMVQTNEGKFQNQFNTILPVISQQYGNQVAGGIQQNLGKGPYDKMNPAIIVHELKTNWIPKLSQNKTPQTFCATLECFLAICIMEGKQTDFDYVALEFSKKTMPLQERASRFQTALKNAH